MSPSYQDSDYVISRRNLWHRYQVGDVVVVRHPTLGTLIKRIAAVSCDYEFWLQGDNPQSTSSAAMGWLAPSCILGKVRWHIKARQPSSARI